MEKHKNAKYLKMYQPIQKYTMIDPNEEIHIPSENNEIPEDNFSEESSEEIIDLNYIITECPDTKIVRRFFEENLKCVVDDEEALFNDNF